MGHSSMYKLGCPIALLTGADRKCCVHTERALINHKDARLHATIGHSVTLRRMS